MFKNITIAFVFAATLVASVASPTTANAQETDEITSTFQGTVGLGIIGAEIGLVIPAAAGMRDVWPYIVFPLIGAGAGAVAGQFLIDQNDLIEVGAATIVAGLALIIPTVVIVVAALMYDPDDEGAVRLDEEGEDTRFVEPDSEDLAPIEEDFSYEDVNTPRFATTGLGAVQLNEGNFQLSAPSIAVSQSFSLQEQALYRAPEITSYHLGVVSGSF